MSKDKDQQIESVLSQEKDTLLDIINSVDNLLEANKQLNDSRYLQQKVKDLKKEYPSLPWFERFGHTIAQVKYLFIKNDEEIAEEKRRTNRTILKHVDNKLRNVGKENLSLQRIIDAKLQAEFDNILTKELSEEQLQRTNRLRESLAKLEIPPEKFSQIAPQVYNADEAKALHQERIRLVHVQQDLVKLVKANSNIKELLAIKKELAELREELPSNLLIKKLKQIVVKIKHVFVNTTEQILKDTITHNNEILKKVDKGLDITGKNIEDSTVARKNRLQKELEKLKGRDFINMRTDKVEALRSELEATFTAAVTASQPLSTSQDQTKSQAMSSSITPTRQAPPPPPIYASLQKQGVQQVAESAIATPTPLMGTTSMPNLTIHQAAGNTITRSLSSSHTSSQNSQDIQHREEIKHTPKRQAPLPPLQNQEVQQAADATIPPAPPLPDQNTIWRSAPPPPPLPPVNNIPPAPPLPQGIQQTTGSVPPLPPPPPPAVEPTAAQNQKPAEVATLQEQGEKRAKLFDEIKRIGKLREEKKLSELRENKVLEEVEKKQKTPPTRSPSPIEDVFRNAIESRRSAFAPDEDEHEHADLVKLIEDKKVSEDTLNILTKKAGVKNDKELIELINDDQIWDDDDREEKRNKVIQNLQKIKENLDRGKLPELPSNPVANIDTAKGQFPPKLQSAAKAIGESLFMPPKDGYKTLPPTPSSKSVGIKKPREI